MFASLGGSYCSPATVDMQFVSSRRSRTSGHRCDCSPHLGNRWRGSPRDEPAKRNSALRHCSGLDARYVDSTQTITCTQEQGWTEPIVRLAGWPAKHSHLCHQGSSGFGMVHPDRDGASIQTPSSRVFTFTSQTSKQIHWLVHRSHDCAWRQT